MFVSLTFNISYKTFEYLKMEVIMEHDTTIIVEQNNLELGWNQIRLFKNKSNWMILIHMVIE